MRRTKTRLKLKHSVGVPPPIYKLMWATRVYRCCLFLMCSVCVCVCFIQYRKRNIHPNLLFTLSVCVCVSAFFYTLHTAAPRNNNNSSYTSIKAIPGIFNNDHRCYLFFSWGYQHPGVVAARW